MDGRVPEHRDSHTSSCHGLSLELACEKCEFGWTQCWCSLPERPKLRDLPEDQNHKGPVQKTHWRIRTSCSQFWWFHYSRSQSSQWRLWISKQSSLCSRGARLSHSMDPGVSVQKQKLLRKHKRSCKSSWSQIGSLKVIYTDNSLEFGKACEDLSWNHCTSTPHRSETNGIAERAVCSVKEGTSAVLLQSGLNESWWTDSMECYTYLRNIQDLLSEGKTPFERRIGEPIILFGSLVEYYPVSGFFFCLGRRVKELVQLQFVAPVEYFLSSWTVAVFDPGGIIFFVFTQGGGDKNEQYTDIRAMTDCICILSYGAAIGSFTFE